MYMTAVVTENQKKKRKYANEINFHINIHLIDGLEMEFTACLVNMMPNLSIHVVTFRVQRRRLSNVKGER